MGLKNIQPGKNIPDEFNVIIEIPANSDPVKYEVDKETNALFVDRFVTTSMRYPCNYGYIPKTLSEDGDPVDVLVITPFPVMYGVVVRCRSIGVLKMEDEHGMDAKLLAVPVSELTGVYDKIQKPEDVPELTLNSIAHFFEHYKDLEPSKWVKIVGWEGKKAAKEEILKSIENYQQHG